jgi:hypothetical protein
MFKPVSRENIKNILKYLPYFENKENKFYTIESNDFLDPYFYSEEVDQFEKALYENNFIQEFDWPAWQEEAEKIFNDPQLLNKSNIETIIKLFTTHIRKERFCSGHLAIMISNGHILNILKRLEELSEQGLTSD